MSDLPWALENHPLLTRSNDKNINDSGEDSV